MPFPRKDDKTDKPATAATHWRAPAREELTCNEEQIEDLLSEGESTEDDGDEKPASKSPVEKPPVR